MDLRGDFVWSSQEIGQVALRTAKTLDQALEALAASGIGVVEARPLNASYEVVEDCLDRIERVGALVRLCVTDILELGVAVPSPLDRAEILTPQVLVRDLDITERHFESLVAEQFHDPDQTHAVTQ